MNKTFPMGGTHPPESKLTANESIIRFPLPEKVFIPMSQHIGAPAKVIVKRGDSVKVGDLIGEKSSIISANIHSSISGKVEKIDKIVDSNGFRSEMVIIVRDGDEWSDLCKKLPITAKIDATKEEIIEKIETAGIVGMGGACFPTQVKIKVPKDKIDTLIINGVECEPFLTSDHRVMLELSDKLIIGTQILQKAVGANKAIIGIENNKKDAIEQLTKLTKDIDTLTIVPLKVKYPQGGEKQLIKALLGREVPSGKLPLDVSVVVQNVGTAVAAYNAVQLDIPLIERVVTVTGVGLKQKGNFSIRIGTPISEILTFCGFDTTKNLKVLNGGPMMGRALINLEAPIVKGSSGILTFNETTSERMEPTPCIKCAECVTVCPMGLIPIHLSRLVQNRNFIETKDYGLYDCIECGCCQFTCPAYRPLLDNIRLGKIRVRNL